MWLQWKNPKLYLMLLCDAILFALALMLAYFLRFEFAPRGYSFQQMKELLPYAIPLKLAVFMAFGLYRGMWRYTGLEDSWKVAEASLVSTLCFIALVLYLPFGDRFKGYSRTVFLLDGVATFLLAGGLRLAIRSYFTALQKRGLGHGLPVRSPRGPQGKVQSVVIVGAGSAGEKIIREIFDNPGMGYRVMGLVDDDPGKRGRSLHGIPVLGPVDDLPEIVSRLKVDRVFIAISRVTGPQMRRIVEVCKTCEVPFKTLPGMREIMKGRVSVKALRDVDYRDLLRRPPVRLDTEDIFQYIAGRKVLVTGCGGSIGSELCRQLVRFDPGALVLLDSGEANLYQIQMELLHDIRFRDIHCILGKVQDRPLVDKVFRKYRPELVFHAAAYKHVPLLEKNPWEAVFNNVLGSRTVMEAAAEHGAERFVLVSTDKAVRPTNVMGASKRVTELILQSLQDSATRFMAVRFGNVVGSSGSVIPLFRRQIELGGPVTVTHPDITRYFMTIPEAAQLILQAGAMGDGGEIFILEMGIPVKIADMARDLVRLSGREPGKDVEIVFTGLREGEKLYEELITEGEGIVATPHEKIMVLRPDGQWNGHGDAGAYREHLDGTLRELYAAAAVHDPCGVKETLGKLVPEYSARDAECVL